MPVPGPLPCLSSSLQGRFSEWWDWAGVQAGDTLSFRWDPATARIAVLRHPGAGANEQVRGFGIFFFM